jgi:hypothetical protein
MLAAFSNDSLPLVAGAVKQHLDEQIHTKEAHVLSRE